ncbi:MAG: hypothetical protein FJY95_20445 [Candidatus Handelsmanbacteria bacterium]|nr:hypothetical protein [Candidatus Handelsmanbacteria bacterium]
MEKALDDCRHHLRRRRWAQVNLLDAAPGYGRRLIELAAGAVLSEALAPEVCIAPRPLSPEAAGWGGRWRHALCFAASPLFTHEFYPLAVDALVRDAACQGRPRFAPLGVHLDWLDEGGKLSRALWLDAEGACLREAELDSPLVSHSAHFLCLGSREQGLHHRWSARLACPQVNPAGAAGLADDKGSSLEGWGAAGVRVPAWRRCGPGDQEEARAWLRRLGEVVVKPNRGTEGEGVAFFARGEEAGLERHLQALWSQGDALLQERADDLVFRDPGTGRSHTLSLRLNLAAAEGRCWAESGYAQVGAGPDQPAAGSQGARCLPIDEVLPHLVRRGDGRPAPMPAPAWAGIIEEAEAAAGLFAGLLLAGLDLVLALGESGAVVPVFLEANARPAGLGHSRFVQGPERGQPGVSLRMWDALEYLVEGRNCEHSG